MPTTDPSPDAAEQRKALSRATFDGQAATYDADRNGSHARELYPHVLREVLDHLRGRGSCRVLDVGCGTGALAEQVLGNLPHCALTGVDLSPAMLERAAKRLGSRADLRLADSEHLPFGEGSFDAVYCNDSFHHYPDPGRAVFEMWRVLGTGGLLVVGDCWLPAPLRVPLNRALPYSRSGDVRIYSERELRDLLGRWFARVDWRRIGAGACLARGWK